MVKILWLTFERAHRVPPFPSWRGHEAAAFTRRDADQPTWPEPVSRPAFRSDLPAVRPPMRRPIPTFLPSPWQRQRESSRDRLPPAKSQQLVIHAAFAAPEGADRAASTSLVKLFRTHSGTMRSDDLANLLEDHYQGDYMSLQELLVAGNVVGFAWHWIALIPMFQFRAQNLSVKIGPQPVLAALPNELNGWACAGWFAQTNALLAGRRPVDVPNFDLWAVTHAAAPEGSSGSHTAKAVTRTKALGLHGLDNRPKEVLPTVSQRRIKEPSC